MLLSIQNLETLGMDFFSYMLFNLLILNAQLNRTWILNNLPLKYDSLHIFKH